MNPGFVDQEPLHLLEIGLAAQIRIRTLSISWSQTETGRVAGPDHT